MKKPKILQAREITNKPLFWTGLSFYIVEVLALVIYGLTLLDWSWVTQRVLFMIGAILMLILYNLFPLLLIKLGTKRVK